MPRLLLVDDNPSIHKIAESLLNGTDVSLVCAESGPRALELIAQSDPFDVALIDISMVGMDGWELLDHLRATAAGCTLPVAMMAGVLDAVQNDRVESSNIQGFLKKPVELRDLADRVRKLMAVKVEPPASAPDPMEGSPFATIPSLKVSQLPELRRTPPPVPATPSTPPAPPAVEIHALPTPTTQAADPVMEDDLLLLTAEDLAPETQEPPPSLELGDQDEVPDIPLEDTEAEDLQAPAELLDLEVEAPPVPTPAFLDALAETPTHEEFESTELEIDLPDLGPAEDDLHQEVLTASSPESAPEPEALSLPEQDDFLGEVPKDWADESETLLSAIEAALPPVPSTTSEPEPTILAIPPSVALPPDSQSLEREVVQALQAGEDAAAEAAQQEQLSEAPPPPEAQLPAPSPAVVPVAMDVTALVAAIAADPVLAQNLAKALLPYLPEAALREVAWEVLPDLADRIRSY